jgi:endonuclease III
MTSSTHSRPKTRKKPSLKRAAEKDESGRVLRIRRELARLYPDAQTELRHENPWQLLVSTILSAQCTDERVNRVTPELFRRLHTPGDFASVPREDLEELIRSTGFFRSKAKSIQGSAERIVADHAGRVPDTMEELVKLPGVGRKTANVILGSAFGKNEGVVVDTHVGRLSRRLGLSKHEDPEKVEQDLMKLIPREEWTSFSHQLVWHGRRVCKALRPRCPECTLAPLCPSAFSS